MTQFDSKTAQHIYWQENDNILTLTGLKNYAADTYINNATVTVTLKDHHGSNVAGAVDLSMTYIVGSNGDYRAILPYTLSCVAHEVYTAEVTADGGAGLRGFWPLPVLIEQRTLT